MGGAVSSNLHKNDLAKEQEHGECEEGEVLVKSPDGHLILINTCPDGEVAKFKAFLCNKTTSEKCFCLFAGEQKDKAMNRFMLVAALLTPFYQHNPSVYSRDVLQPLVFCILRNPDWSSAEVAKHLELDSLLANPDCQSTTTPQQKQEAIEKVITPPPPQGTSFDVAKEMVEGIGADYSKESSQDAVPFFQKALASAEKMGDQFRKGFDLIQEYSNSPVHLAIRVGNSGLLIDLLKGGASDELSCADVFPIHLAMKHEQLPCARVLLIHNHDNVHLKDGKYHGSPLHWAKSSKAMELLMGMGGDVDARNEFNETPLHIMTKRRRLQCAVYLLSSNADVNAKDKDGKTSLHYAVQMKDLPLVKTLLVFGADQGLCDDQGSSPGSLTDGGIEDDHVILDALKLYCRDDHVTSKREDSVAATATEAEAFTGSSILKSKCGKETVLCLDGGGIRGLILLEMLFVLIEECGEEAHKIFDWVSGTSTGSYLAILLSQGASLRDVHCRYFRLKQRVFSGSKPYNSEELEKVLIDSVGENTTMDSLTYPRVIVPVVAADRKPAQLQLIRSYSAPYARDCVPADSQMLTLKPPHEQVLWKAIRYSASAPSYFRPLDAYLDGGFIANNPTLDVLTEINEYHKFEAGVREPSEAAIDPMACVKSTNEAARRCMDHVGVVISLGTGEAPLEPVPVVDLFAPTSFDDAQRVLLGVRTLGELLIDQSTCTDGHMVERAKNWCESIGAAYFRFNPPMTSDWQLDEQDDAEIIAMLYDARKYIKHNMASFRQAADLIMGRS